MSCHPRFHTPLVYPIRVRQYLWYENASLVQRIGSLVQRLGPIQQFLIGRVAWE